MLTYLRILIESQEDLAEIGKAVWDNCLFPMAMEMLDGVSAFINVEAMYKGNFAKNQDFQKFVQNIFVIYFVAIIESFFPDFYPSELSPPRTRLQLFYSIDSAIRRRSGSGYARGRQARGSKQGQD